MVCRGLLLMLERAGQITLPPVSYVRHIRWQGELDQSRRRSTPRLWKWGYAISSRLSLSWFDAPAKSRCFDSLMEEHHYLGYEQPVGEHLKYLVSAQGRPVACLAWSSAPRHLGSRDRYLGWSAEARRRNIRFIAYNTRFLILPWVRVEHLASHILGAWRRESPQTGSGCTDIRFTFWRPSWMRSASAGPVTGRPTGYCLARRRDGASNRIATWRTGRSKRFWGIR
jgi:hypothetical protein